MLVAPCSANTLAKISNGICDNLLTSLLRATPSFVPVLLFPAMNTHMYTHPFTAKQLGIVQNELGYVVHGPIGKVLACGDVGASTSPSEARAYSPQAWVRCSNGAISSSSSSSSTGS